MKKIILIAATISIFGSIVANAQKTSFGIAAGVNMQNLNGKDLVGTKLKNQLAPKYFVGVNMAIPIAEDFYIQPGLIYTTKGAKSESGNEKINLGYIEIPINFLYKPVLGNGHLLFGFGPYLGRGINGKFKTSNLERTVNYKNTITAGDLLSTNKVYVKPFDIGGNIFAGFEMASGLSFQLNTQLGLIDINPKITGLSADQSSLKNTGFGLSLGYKIK